MANLGKKNGVYLARFRYQGKEYKRSLKTTEHGHAHAAMRRVEDAPRWLAIGTSSGAASVGTRAWATRAGPCASSRCATGTTCTAAFMS